MIDLDSIAEAIADQILGQEYPDEKQRQAAVSKKIKGGDLDAPAKDEDEKPRLTDEADEEEEEEEEEKDIEPKPVPSSDDDEDAGDFEVEAKKELPKKVTFDVVKQEINNLRAGKSLKDDAVSGQLRDYFEKLGQAEESSLYVFLSSLAAILTGGTSGEDAPRPESMGINIDMKPKSAKKDKRAPIPGVDAEGAQAPIIVGESSSTFTYKMRLLENMTADDAHRCLGGKQVKFGSPRCIKDLNIRIDDTTQSRDACKSGTADRASLNGTLKYLRQKLRAANKIAALKG